MKIQKIVLKNFRSIGEDGLELTFPVGSSIIIGENNVGKTSIFEAIKMMINLEVLHTIPWEIENWYASDQTKPIDLTLTIELDDDDIKKIISFFDPLRITSDNFKKIFSNMLVYRIFVPNPKNRPESFFQFGEFIIHNNEGRTGNIEGNKTRYSVRWEDIVELGAINSIEKSIRKLLAKDWSANKQQMKIANTLDIAEVRISFSKEVPKSILELLKQEIIPIEEYREKPNKKLDASLVSPTGINLVSILFNLKNGRPTDKAKFEKIREKFHDIFPNLDLDVIREGEEIKILTQKNKVESTTQFLGSGVLQILLLITHIVAYKNKIILIDHPEVHLHPHAERNLSALIDESEGTQIFLITHSPYFVKIDKQHKIFRLTQKSSHAVVDTLQPDFFTEKEYKKFEYLLDIGNKEIFFAKKVLLVEGPTEYGAIPIFADAQKYSFDKYGVSIVDVGGKSNLGLFARLCEGYHIPYLILADMDAAEELKKIDIPNKMKQYRFHLLSKDFEALLPDDLLQDAKKTVGSSKPRMGKYVATEMIRKKVEISPEIISIINKLKMLQD